MHHVRPSARGQRRHSERSLRSEESLFILPPRRAERWVPQARSVCLGLGFSSPRTLWHSHSQRCSWAGICRGRTLLDPISPTRREQCHPDQSAVPFAASPKLSSRPECRAFCGIAQTVIPTGVPCFFAARSGG